MIIIFSFFVLFIAFCFVKKGEVSSSHNKEVGDMAKDLRVTNARLENELLQKYLDGKRSFEDAYQLALLELTALGYDPCIGVNYYTSHYGDVLKNGYCDILSGRIKIKINPDSFDSKSVILSRELCKKTQKETSDENIYSNLPMTKKQYNHAWTVLSRLYSMPSVGTFISHPALDGTSEVVWVDKKDGLWFRAISLKTRRLRKISYKDTLWRRL